jgi:hypothetical protein
MPALALGDDEGEVLVLFPDAVQREALAERCAADPGSFHAPSLERSRVSSASTRVAALRPGKVRMLRPLATKSKRGKATPQQDIDLIDTRLKRAAELHAAARKENRP